MKEIARQMGIPYTTYVNYEKGLREPSTETIIAMRDFYGCSLECILGIPEQKATNQDFEYIRGKVSRAELLAALAEEAAEMVQAALKARRALTCENPTPKSFERCIQDLTEEISDVMVCAEALELNPDHAIMALKRERWVIRLEDREG